MPEAVYLVPSLTSVRQHLADVGRMAVQELHQAVASRSQGEVSPTTRLITPELVIRESSRRL